MATGNTFPRYREKPDVMSRLPWAHKHTGGHADTNTDSQMWSTGERLSEKPDILSLERWNLSDLVQSWDIMPRFLLLRGSVHIWLYRPTWVIRSQVERSEYRCEHIQQAVRTRLRSDHSEQPARKTSKTSNKTQHMLVLMGHQQDQHMLCFVTGLRSTLKGRLLYWLPPWKLNL